MNEIKFPAFRKYIGVETYFRIESNEIFEEIRRIGEKFTIEIHHAKILPDRNFIHDLLYDFRNFAEEITPEEYEKARKMAF
jgi:hypothetical protein